MRFWKRSSVASKGYTPPSKFRELLYRITHFGGWTAMLHDYNPRTDHYIRMAITLGMVKECDNIAGYSIAQRLRRADYHIQVGPHELWVANYPYSYGVHANGLAGRPSYETIRLLRKEQLRILDQITEEFLTCSSTEN